MEWLWEQMAFARRGRPGASMDYFAAMTAFVRTADLGSFSKAAAEAGVKVSTVSRYVGALEADLGAALLNRSTRRLHLTEAGRSFYERATQILAEVEDARGATRALNVRAQGLLRINIPSAFGRRHVMPHMKDFLADHPDVRLDATLTDAVVDLIETGADVAVRIGALVDSTFCRQAVGAPSASSRRQPGLPRGSFASKGSSRPRASRMPALRAAADRFVVLPTRRRAWRASGRSRRERPPARQ